ncbi:dopamine D2-like receptor [Seriola dumerili]|uniref:dopamine D2-like receptor n=1 Tax=Seriola dumerili TaxID=41447 RepID=UPI000BBEE562|nr:dopamine D2-like receptor [Seriola dumerili]
MRAEPLPAWDSGNSTIWEKYIDITFVVANSLILLTTSVVGIAANIFVILAVYHQKSLQTWNNALVVNLAIIDILRCVIDCPILLTIVMALHQRGNVGESICDAQVASFSFSCCIQLLTLACISAERYQAIAQPFKTSQRKKRITVLIPLTWTLAILMSVFCLIFVKDSPVHMKCKGSQRETSSSYDTFGLYMLFPLWAACFGVIIGFYARIFLLVRSHNRKIFDKGTFALSKKQKTEDKKKKEEVVENANSEQKQTLNKNVAQVELVTQAEPNSSKKDSSTALLTSRKAAQCASSSECNPPETEAPKQNVEAEGAVCMMPSKANKDRANKKKEGKMAKRAGYIIVTFLLFWLPLITTILVNFFVRKNRNTRIKIIQDVEILSVSVACITSLSDPIIYAAVNPQFRTEFYRLKNKVKSTFSKT